MQPEAFDHVQERTVFGQPVDLNAIFKQTESGLHGFTTMVGGVIHDPNQRFIRILCDERFQKFNETITIFTMVQCVAYV